MNLERCDLCPKRCGVNRKNSQFGFCKAKDKVEISWYGKHFGEEPVISGLSRQASQNGSGTIFFCHCNLKCVFCQNWQISQESGEYKRCREQEEDEVVGMMLELQAKRAHNINLVSPTVWSFWLKEILGKARKKGLKIPVVWNSNGYEEAAVLRELGNGGIIDVYLPDYKYSDEKLAIKYSSAPDYPKIAREAILEMQEQVGDLVLDGNGIAQKGLIVRHLVLPGQIENTKNCLKFIRSISEDIHLSLMSQYNPAYRANNFPEINRELTKKEWEEVLKMVKDLKFKYGWIQRFDGSAKCLNPDFSEESPFGEQGD